MFFIDDPREIIIDRGKIILTLIRSLYRGLPNDENIFKKPNPKNIIAKAKSQQSRHKVTYTVLFLATTTWVFVASNY
ncbi:hypothetical protein B5D82_13585 [Cognaticolwellia beringensis]|uniref:Uncharacterized protein n=1 Tax=Cognaticolwellia beringensis TaxID=1967665 RepID=A0A222GAR5_9GAMM|nr:hypothetical protein B5D82_13585 [Cognaticolwellia beringensis]